MDNNETKTTASEFAAPLIADMKHVTNSNAPAILGTINAAYKSLKKNEFKTFAAQLSLTVTDTKTAMRKQLIGFINRLAVSDTQTRF